MEILKEKLDVTILVLYILNFIPLIYLAQKGVSSAAFYVSMASYFGGLIFLIMFFFGAGDTIFKKIPISKNTTQGGFYFLLGIAVFLAIRLFGVVVSKFLSPFFIYSQTSVESFLIPGFRFLQWFIQGFSAGIVEEIMFSLVFTSLGMIVGDWMLDRLNVRIKDELRWWVVFGIGTIFSVIIFTIFHSFNPVYTTTSQFLVAAAFKVIVNIIVWTIFDLNFGIGFHVANNSASLGASVLLAALVFNIYGLFMILLLGFMIFDVVKNWDKIKFIREQ